jgi:hypothetical protein
MASHGSGFVYSGSLTSMNPYYNNELIMNGNRTLNGTLTASGDIRSSSSLIPGSGSAAMTNGFTYIPSDNGPPTSGPVMPNTFLVPLYFDKLNKDLYVNTTGLSSGWVKVRLT